MPRPWAPPLALPRPAPESPPPHAPQETSHYTPVPSTPHLRGPDVLSAVPLPDPEPRPPQGLPLLLPDGGDAQSWGGKALHFQG